MKLALPLVMHEPRASDALARATGWFPSIRDSWLMNWVMNSMAESACNMIDEQSARSGNPLPDLAWVETLFAALAGGHSANDDTAAMSVTEQELLIDTVVAEETVAGTADNEVESEVMSTAATSSQALSMALPAQCLLRDAVEMKATMLEQAAADTMTVDVGTVERVDAAFMQILVSLVKQRQVQGKALPAWQGSSAALTEAAQVLGLTDLMKFPAA